MGSYLEYAKKKRKGEEEEKVSSSSNAGGSYSQYAAGKRLGIDTLESDLADMGNTISNIYSEWQTPETMANTRSSVEAMQKRVNDYATYQKKYMPDSTFDVDTLASGYQTILDDWDKLTETYSAFKDAESYKNYPNYLKSLEEEQKKKDERVKALDNSFDQYKDYLSKEDYAEMSQYKSTAKREGISGFFGIDTYDETYEFINNENDMRNMLIAKYKEGNGATELEQHGYQYMTDEEKGVYNYKYAVEGKESADQYLKDLEISLNKRVYDESTAKWEKMSETPTGSIGLSLISPITSMAGGIGSGIETIKEKITGEKYNPYAPGRVASNATSDIRGYVGENIAEATDGAELFGKNVFSQVYGALMSGADSLLMIKSLGPLGLTEAITPIMAMNSYQQTAKEMTEAGEDEETVQWMAIASGAIEYITEKIGVDNFFKLKNPDSIKAILGNMVSQAKSEGFEGFLSEISNMIVDDVIRGDESELLKKYNDLIARGYSESEAKTELAKYWGSNLFWATAGDAISGGVLGGIDSAIRTNDLKQKGAEIRSNDRVSEMMDVAGDAFMSLSEKDAYKAYTEYANKGVTAENISDVQLGNLYANVVQNIDDVSHSKTATPQEQNDIRRQIEGLETVNKAKTTKMADTGKAVNIEGVKSVDGERVLQTSEGEVKTKDVKLSHTDAELMSYAEGMDDSKANLMLSQYDGKSDVEAYVNSFNLAYSYGETGFGTDFVLKNKGVLTERQALNAYKEATMAKARKNAEAFENAVNKTITREMLGGRFDDSIIDYDGSGKGTVKWNMLTSSEKMNINAAKVIAGAMKNTKFEFIESRVENGEYKGENARWNPTTRTISIDVHAGRNKLTDENSYIMSAMSHEITHSFERTAAEEHANLRDHVMNYLANRNGIDASELIARKRMQIGDSHAKRGIELTDERVINEIVADACEEMLVNSKKVDEYLKGMDEHTKKSFVGKVKETFENIIKAINDVIKKLDPRTKEARALRESKEDFEKTLELWDKAFVKANESHVESISTDIEINKALTAEGITGEQVIGENLFTETTAQLSMRTYENEGRELLHKWLENSDLDAKTKTDIIEQMDHVYDVASKYAEDNSLVDFGSWSETDIIRGEDGSPLLSVVVPNGDYPLNIDFSQVCKKRKTLNAVLNALVRSGDLDFRSLSQSDINSINRIIKEHGFEIACALCFVDSKRYRVNDWADSFTDTYNKLVKSLVKGTDFVVDEFNYTGRPVKGAEGKLLKDADDSELNFDYINEVLAKNSSGKAIYRYALAIKNNKDLRSILRSSEIISSAGLDAIKVQNRTLYDLVNSHQGSAKPKLAHGEVPYAYDILLQKKFNVEDAYKVGGVRMQSFSDYMANMFFDYVQMIGDLSAKQLPAHAYTKEYYFAKLFGLTGIKINLSIVPKGADITDEQKARFNKMTKAAKEKDPEFRKLKAHSGLDANGNYILEDETFPLDKALELQSTEGYDKNCGIIWVGVSDAHIDKMLDDDNVPFIIPYHKSSLNPAIARMRNIDFYNDYTKQQNTRYDTKAKKKVPASVWSFDFYADLAKTNDPRQTAKNYVDECRSRGYLPKFDKWADHPNYYKLLVDFRVYDGNGNYAPQSAVKMQFPDDFNEIIGESLRSAQDTQTKLDASMSGLLDEIRKELKIESRQYSNREYVSSTDPEILDLVNKVNDGTAGKKEFRTIGDRISKRLADAITSLVGFDVHGYGNEIDSGQISHIIKEHGAHGRSDKSMSDMRDIARIGYIVDNFDKIRIGKNKTKYKNSDGTEAKTVEIQKKIGDSYFYVVEAVPDHKLKKLRVVSAYINKNDTFPLEAVPNGPSRYVQDESESNVSIDIIPQDENHSQYSDRDSDGNTLTAEQMEYFKDSKARDAEGNLLVVYHGTRSGGFNEFSHDAIGSATDYGYLGRGFYFTGRESVAKYYAGYLNSSEVKKGYVNVTNPIILPDKRDLAYYMESLMKSGSFDILYEDDANYERSIAFTKWLKDNGYDGVICKDEIMVLNSNQFKNIDNTNPTEDADIRYSDRYEDAFFDLFDSDGTFAESSAIIEEDVNRLKQRLSMGASSMSDDNIQMIAKHLRKIADSSYDNDELMDELKDIYGYIEHHDYFDGNALVSKCNDVARRILSEQREHKVTNDYAKMVLKDIRATKIKLNAEQIAEAKNRYGEKYRNALFGRITISNEGISLDSKWQEWSGQYPSIFSADVNSADMINELADIYDSLREASETGQRFAEVNDVRALGAEIYNQYWIRSTVQTESEKNQQKVKELNLKHRNAMKKLREDYQKRLENQRLADSMHYGKIINEIRQKNKDEVKKAKALGKERMDKYKDRVARNAKIEQITKNAMTLNDWLRKNSKDHHIPEVMKAPVAYLLNAIDFSSKQLLGMNGANKFTPTKTDISLSEALEQVHEMVVNASQAQMEEDFIMDFPPNMQDEIRNLSKGVNIIMRTVGDNAYVLNQMSLEQLESLDSIIKIIKHSVTQMNDFFAVKHSAGVANLSQSSMAYMNSLGKIVEKTGKTSKAVSKLLNWGNITPYYAFKKFGEGGKAVYEALQTGWDTFAFHAKEIIDYAEENYTEKEVKEWSEHVHTFDVLEPASDSERKTPGYKPSYQKLHMTDAQIMALYCLQKRDQAKGHLIGGGIRPTDIDNGKKVISQPDGAMLSESDIDTIINSLTPRQIEVADKLQEFMNTTCTDWGNEVSMERFGIKAFGEENYFPIQSDKNNLAVDDAVEQNSLYRLLNMSFTKGTIKNANNRVLIGNIFDVFAQHTSDMAKYNALALPVLDAFKWYNYKEKDFKGDTQRKETSLKQSMEKAFGKDANNYFTTFMRDLNGEKNVGRDSLSGIFFTNAKIASVGFNIRVVALQPTAYLRASAVIDPKYMIKAFMHKPKTDRAEKYCGIALWKSLGYYDVNIQRGLADQIKQVKTKKDKVTDFAMKGAEIADKVTWGYLWNACELEVRDKRKDLKVGTDEFYKEVGTKLREVIYATQVVDSTMTRSHLMRSNEMWHKMMTSFMSEPTIAYNMLADTYTEWKLTERQTGSKNQAFKKHGKKMARVFMAYTVTNMLAALVEAGFDIFRDDEEMTEEALLEAYLKNFKSDMNPLNKIPYVKEVTSLLEGYSSSRTDTQWLQYLVKTAEGIQKHMEGKGNVYTTAKNAMRAFSYATGLPVYNLWRDTMAAMDKSGILTSEELDELFNDTIGSIFPSLKAK